MKAEENFLGKKNIHDKKGVTCNANTADGYGEYDDDYDLDPSKMDASLHNIVKSSSTNENILDKLAQTK